MGIILRQGFANTVYSFAGAFIGFINVIWLYPFVLESGQFGLTRVMISIGIIGAQLASLGMGNVTLRFFPQFRNRVRKHFGYLFLATVIPLAGFLVLSLAGWIFRSQIIAFYTDETALFGNFYLLLLPLLLFILYFHILETYIRSLFDTVATTFLQDILLRLFHTVVVLVYFFGWTSFGTFMWMFVLSYGLQTLLMLLYIAWKRQLFLIPDFSVLTRERVRSMTDYALFAILGSVTAMALGNIDMLMVGGLTSLADTAVFAVGFYLASLLKIPSKGLIKISQPLIAEAHHKNDITTISQIYRKSSINQLLVGGTLFIMVWTNIDHLYRFLPDEYAGGVSVFLFIGIAKLIDMTSGFNAIIIRTSSWYRFDLYATILLLILIVSTNLILIPLFGITGAAMATALSVLIQNSVYVYYVKLRFDILPFTKKTMIALAMLAGILVLVAWIPTLPFWLGDMAFQVILTGVLVTAGILTLRLSNDLEEVIRETFHQIRNLLTRR